jgi:hypothetical protein
MCLLVARLAGSNWTPTDAEFNNAWDANPHGFGLSWKSDQLWINKTLDRNSARQMIKDVPDGAPMILHWRLATHGSKTLDNCHPWSIFKGQWVGAHNGVLSRQKCIGDMTDSQSFMLGLSGSEPRIHGIEKAIRQLGYGKMAFLSQQGEMRIANEHEGSWRIPKQVWQSNDGLDPRWHSYAEDWADYRGINRVGFSSWRPAKPIDNRFKPLECEWCNKHAKLYRFQDDLCCADCVDTVIDCYAELNDGGCGS